MREISLWFEKFLWADLELVVLPLPHAKLFPGVSPTK